MDVEIRRDAVQRLASASGHIRGIERMVADDAYCIDVINQIQAVQAALKAARPGVVARAGGTPAGPIVPPARASR